MKPVFVSRHARINAAKQLESEKSRINEVKSFAEVKENANVIILPELKKPTICWIGEKFDALNFSGSFGFDLIDLNKKYVSYVVLSQALILNNVKIEDKARSALNMACEYGIHTIWIHNKLQPVDRLWSFNLCLVGEYKPLMLWEKICSLR